MSGVAEIKEHVFQPFSKFNPYEDENSKEHSNCSLNINKHGFQRFSRFSP